ncbi:MAG: pyrroline-5-carboxylate reductase [Clostridia bacterium]|nr:pyrroline-5-carboxylate reductase [Clostridia bacterium]
MKRIGFIGAGNMGGALCLAASKADCALYVSDPDTKKAQALCKKTGATWSDHDTVCTVCDLIFLGVKPQMLSDVAAQLSPALDERTTPYCLVSMCAGVTLSRLGELFPGAAVIRIMPNTPVAVGQGMIQYCYNEKTTRGQIDTFLYAMQHAGKVDLLDEALFDAATAVSGCGPAFAYMFADALAKGGAECGLPYEKAAEYASQMLLGAALMLQNDPRTPEELRIVVCSPGGSTIEGVKVMQQNGLEQTVIDTVKASFERNKQLGK